MADASIHTPLLDRRRSSSGGVRSVHQPAFMSPVCGSCLARIGLRKPPRMSTLQWYEMGPLEKWKHYRVAPVRPVVHLLLVVLSTALVVLYSGVHGISQGPLGLQYTKGFYPPEWARYSGDPTDYPELRFMIYTKKQFRDAVFTAVDTYFTLPHEGLGVFKVYGSDPYRTVPMPTIALEYYDDVAAMYSTDTVWDGSTATAVHTIPNASYVFPFSGAPLPHAYSLDDLLAALVRVTIGFRYQHVQMGASSRTVSVHQCQRVHQSIDMSFHEHGGIQVTSFARLVGSCSSVYFSGAYAIASIQLAAIILAFMHFSATCITLAGKLVLWRQLASMPPVSHIGHTHDVCHVVSPTKQPPSGGGDGGSDGHGHGHGQVTVPAQQHGHGTAPGSDSDSDGADGGRIACCWASLAWHEKLQIFSVWLVMPTAANLLLVIFSFKELSTNGDFRGLDADNIFLGLSCAMYWLSLTQFLEFSTLFYMMVITIKRAAPKIAALLLGVVPLFMGFATFGLYVFGSYSTRFTSWPRTFITLFAVVNGDAMRETFNHIETPQSLWFSLLADVYLYVFVLLFMYVVLNILIAIAEEVFFIANQQGEDTVRLATKLRVLLAVVDRRDRATGAVSSL